METAPEIRFGPDDSAERRAGKTRLVYDKATKEIVAVPTMTPPTDAKARRLIPLPRGMSAGFYAFMAPGCVRTDSGELLMLGDNDFPEIDRLGLRRMCEGCTEGNHHLCGMQTWCECDCEGPDGCMDDFDPQDDRPEDARPLWMGNAANTILEKWKEWEGEACQASTAEQSDEAGNYVLLARIEQTIADAYEKEIPRGN